MNNCKSRDFRYYSCFNFTIHPNPTTGELTITSAGNGISNIEILDVTGRKLSSHPLVIPSSYQKFDLSNLNKGIYFIKIDTNQGVIIKKVVKK